MLKKRDFFIPGVIIFTTPCFFPQKNAYSLKKAINAKEMVIAM
jgi:hypothetical protein